MSNKTYLPLLILFLASQTIAQDTTVNAPTKNRIWTVGAVNVGLWGGSFYALNKTWYSNHQQTAFHLYNDWGEWNQMDKLGHAWSSYQIADHSAKIWQWAGLKPSKAVWVGSLSSMAYLSIVEVLDGYSEKWGFSITDLLANSSGSLFYLSQSLLWKDQRIRIKMSYSPYHYGEMKNRADQLFGKSVVEKLLKDYNGQTYWTSVNIRSFFPNSPFPVWLNLAVGYGSRTLLGGYENKWIEPNGQVVNHSDINRYRRIYVSLDIDLTKIKTEKKGLKTIFSVFNVLKFPAPSIEFNTMGKVRMHPIFF